MVNYSEGNPKIYEDLFTNPTPETYIDLDVKTDLGKDRNIHDGYIKNDGAGTIGIQFSNNGTDFCEEITLKSGEQLSLAGSDIAIIRLVYVADANYRIYVN